MISIPWPAIITSVLVAFVFGIQLGEWITLKRNVKEQIDKSVEENSIPANMAIWDDRLGNQWMCFIMPDQKFYLYCNGQAMGEHGDTTITKYAKRRW